MLMGFKVFLLLLGFSSCKLYDERLFLRIVFISVERKYFLIRIVKYDSGLLLVGEWLMLYIV